MEIKQIEKKFIKLFKQNYGWGNPTLETSFDETSLDSLDLVELLMATEEEFNIQISDADAERVKTIKDAVQVIKEELAKATKEGE